MNRHLHRVLPLVLLSLLLAGCLPAVQAQQGTVRIGEAPPLTVAMAEPRLITVNGEAEVRVVPDEVILTLGLQTSDDDLEAAKRANDEELRRVLAVTEEYGIPARHVQTDYVNIEPRYRDEYEEWVFLGYWVRKNVVITLREVDQFEDLLTDLLATGVRYVHGIEFRTTELRQHRDEARALAVQAAREKAEALAGELGQQVGQPQTIQEVQSGWGSSYNSWWGARWGSAMTQNVIQNVGGEGTWSGDGTVAPGQIAVTARVSVSFALE